MPGMRQFGRRPGIFAAAVRSRCLLLAALAGCTPEHNQSTFDTTGPVAESQLRLFYWIFWAAVFVFVVVEGILLYAVHPVPQEARRPGPQADTRAYADRDRMDAGSRSRARCGRGAHGGDHLR